MATIQRGNDRGFQAPVAKLAPTHTWSPTRSDDTWGLQAAVAILTHPEAVRASGSKASVRGS